MIGWFGMAFTGVVGLGIVAYAFLADRHAGHAARDSQPTGQDAQLRPGD